MIEKMLHTLMGELQKISRAETVIGEAIPSGDSTLVPICRVQIGFGAGGSLPENEQRVEGKSTKASGAALGGGIRVEPVACVVVDKTGRAQLLQLSGGTSSTVGKVIDLVPEVLERLGLTRESTENQDQAEKKTKK